MRDDLPLGLAAAQIAHAAGESSPGDIKEGTHAVVLECTRTGLYEFAERCIGACIPHAAVWEDDHPYRGELMAIGLRPAPKSLLRNAVKRYKLFGSKGGP